MKRDSIFYQLFKRSPTILFALVPHPPADPQGYTFGSVAVKETTFTIDGVFLPPSANGDVVFTEVQFQPDPKLDERILSESAMFIYRNIEAFQDWRIVIIYPSRSIEQSRSKMPPELFTSGRITRIYLDELGEMEQLPIGTAMMVLTTKEGDTAVTAAKSLLARSAVAAEKNDIMDMVVTIMSYKFSNLNREEVIQMLDITIKEVRAFQDAKNEGIAEGIAEGQLSARREMLLELIQEGLGSLSPKSQAMVAALSIDQLKQLSVARKNFKTEKDLKDWLKKAKE